MLSKADIVRAASEILDDGGTSALTFRSLTTKLSTGPGALYHHVANKDELLAAATSEALATLLTSTPGADPRRNVRGVLLGVLDVVRTRPWVGTRLAAAPWQPAVLHLFDRVGTELVALGVPDEAQFDAASVLIHHLLGVVGQYDAASHSDVRDVTRPAFLRSASDAAVQTGRYEFLARIADRLATHDDSEQFRAGIDLILAGIETA